MFRRGLALCAVMAMATVANAGVAVSLVPANPGVGGVYNGGETFNVDVMAQIDGAGPASFRVRLLTLDMNNSSPGIGISGASTHPGTDVGDIFFWDFGSTPTCSGDPAACGDLWFIDSDLGDKVANITYTGLTTSSSRQITLTQAAAKRVGVMTITLPAVQGEYLLDVLNAGEQDPNKGGALTYGFGTTPDPRVDLRAFTGGMTGGQARFVVIPEPATLMLLGLGGVAAAIRRRKTA